MRNVRRTGRWRKMRKRRTRNNIDKNGAER
jgi:hypothetical protein